MYGWLNEIVQTARLDHWEFVLNLYAHTSEIISLTPEMRSEFRHHWLRTGPPVGHFLKRLANPPTGLTAGMIRRWISHKPPARVQKAHIEWILETWRGLPNHALSPPPRAELRSNLPTEPTIAVTPEIHAELRHHWLRIGLRFHVLFAQMEDPPHGLTVNVLRGLLGTSPPRRARTAHLDFILNELEKFPDNAGKRQTAFYQLPPAR
jgi:hypothetical protein